MQTLGKDWQQWIRDGFSRGCAKNDMMKVMLKAGISETSAAYHLVTFSAAETSDPVQTHPAAQTQSVATVAQHNSEYKQEASYLFQYENHIVTSDGQHVQVAMRIDAPDVVLLDHFMTDAECDEICELSKGTLTKSMVVDDATGGNVDHAQRISQGTYFTIGQHAVVKRIEQRIGEITNTPVVNGEGLQILNYVGGGEYRPHFDYFPDNEGGRVHKARGGQRIITVIMYLNNVTAGGATILPEIKLSIYPKKGSALYFSYFNSLGQVDPITLHGGAPVIEGEKWIATKWIRGREYK
jgi:prolyl 4-hydroxylase